MRPVNSFQELKPGQLIFVKYPSFPPWPCLTMDMEYLDEGTMKEKVLESKSGPIPVRFLGDTTHYWPILSSMMIAEDDELPLLMKRSKKQQHVRALKYTLKLLESEKRTGVDRYEIFLREQAFISDDKEFIKSNEFGQFTDFIEDFGFEVTDELREVQKQDNILLRGKGFNAQRKKQTLMSKKRVLEDDEESDESFQNESNLESEPTKESKIKHEEEELPNQRRASKKPRTDSEMKQNIEFDSRSSSKEDKKKYSPPTCSTTPLPDEDNEEVIRRQAERSLSFKALDEVTLEKFCIAARNSLQLTLIQRKTIPSLEEYKKASALLNDFENIGKHGLMTVQILRSSKIHKVLKALVKKEFQQPKTSKQQQDVDQLLLSERSEALFNSWLPIIHTLLKEKLNIKSASNGNK